jgi:hypothetical protein
MRIARPHRWSRSVAVGSSVVIFLLLNVGSVRSTEAQGGSARLSGVFYGTELRSQLNFSTNSYGYRTIKYTFVFTPSGRVLRGVPVGGVSRFNFNSAEAASRANVGRYRLNGSSVEITWGDGSSTSLEYASQSGVMSLGRVRLTRMASPESYRLDGTYGTESYVNLSQPAGLPQSSFSSWRRITFMRDGRFTTEGASGVDTDNPSGQGYARNSSVGSGTYRISDYTM